MLAEVERESIQTNKDRHGKTMDTANFTRMGKGGKSKLIGGSLQHQAADCWTHSYWRETLILATDGATERNPNLPALSLIVIYQLSVQNVIDATVGRRSGSRGADDTHLRGGHCRGSKRSEGISLLDKGPVVAKLRSSIVY
jgi:hypothetical protein